MQKELSDREKWDQRYRERGPEAFGLEPSDWLRHFEELLREHPSGPALDLACGNGRNALWLARLGFKVEAIDISPVAIKWLKKQAQNAQLSVQAKALDLSEMSLPTGHYQVILNFNFLERDLFPKLERALAAGGLLIFETFTRDQIDLLGAGICPKYTLGYNELLHAFPSLRVLHYREGIFCEEGKKKKRGIASLVAQKL